MTNAHEMIQAIVYENQSRGDDCEFTDRCYQYSLCCKDEKFECRIRNMYVEAMR